MGWAKEELSRIDLGDQRLNARSIKLLQQFAAKPATSIPGACGGWAETIAAYRFFAQEEIDWRDILQPHIDCSFTRMRAQPVVLCLQDTTELDFNGRQTQGLGPLSYEAQRGMYVHPTYAVTPERLPLGVLDAWMWAREAKDEQGERPGILESLRWIEGYERIAERATELPETRLVYVADREADILALMQRADALGNPADWLIRAKHNRKLTGETDKLWDKVAKTDTLGELSFYLPPRAGRQGRKIVQQMRTLRISFPAENGGTFEATAILAKEIDPPAGEKPLEWRLLTNRAANTLSEAAEYVDWYRCRWEIEMFFNILKNGCQVEALQLSAISRIELALALFMIIAWRIGYLMRLGRECPELDCEVVFDREEWQAAWLVARKPLPPDPPKLNEAIRLIASFGGFLGRKGDGEPGAKSLWQGLQRVMDFAMGIRAVRET
ncbi:IS4 family transposase [Methylomarinum sp. Ch1-1]|uniref:IS4 family transposase n=1 Tax=Methylomarinum roseum TaxID=3067653 RepID=A0AAU7NTA4_9GAMM|nr:IS4 family transposase [Methylomarinum sp. Ch1-1]MDP4519846.1 IS4 family transposase [Methylomarinum sp. Ch1-1]